VSSRTGEPLLLDLGLDELGQQGQGLFPPEIAGLGGDRAGYAFLHDGQLRADGNLFQGDRRLHLTGQVRVVELAVWRMRVFGTSSRNSPPNEWLCPVVRFVKGIRSAGARITR